MQTLQLALFGLIAVVLVFFLGSAVLGGVFLATDDGAQELISGDAEDISVRVEGTRGLRFVGAIGSVGSNRSVEGAVPASYTLEGEGSHGVFTVFFQKMVAPGTLRITLMCREGMQTSETTANYGAVTVTCTP